MSHVWIVEMRPKDARRNGRWSPSVLDGAMSDRKKEADQTAREWSENYGELEDYRVRKYVRVEK